MTETLKPSEVLAVLAEIVGEHRERESRFADYHVELTRRGERSYWSKRASEESRRAEAIELAASALAAREEQ